MPPICDFTRSASHSSHSKRNNSRTAACRVEASHSSTPDVRAASSVCEVKYTCPPTLFALVSLLSSSSCLALEHTPTIPPPPPPPKHNHNHEDNGHRHQRRPCFRAAQSRARSPPPVQWRRQSQQLVAPRPSSLRLPQYGIPIRAPTHHHQLTLHFQATSSPPPRLACSHP
jgi:hypothetical protein